MLYPQCSGGIGGELNWKKIRRKKRRWRGEQAVCLLSGGWWLGGAGALLYPLSIGFCGGAWPQTGSEEKKNKWMRHGISWSAHV